MEESLTELAEQLQIHLGGSRPRARIWSVVSTPAMSAMLQFITSAVLLTKEGCRRWPMLGYAIADQFQGNEPMVMTASPGLKARMTKNQAPNGRVSWRCR